MGKAWVVLQLSPQQPAGADKAQEQQRPRAWDDPNA